MSWTKTFRQIFRNWITDGVPSSGIFEPIKDEIRTWGDETEGLIAQLLNESSVGTGPFVILGFGDSNLIGNTNATGGDDASNANVKFWKYDTGAWKNDALGVLPFRVAAGNPNNLLRAFAHRVQEETGRDVYVIMYGVPGTTLADWTDSSMGIPASPANGWNSFKSYVAAAFASAELTGKASADCVVTVVGTNNGARHISLAPSGEASALDYMTAIVSQCRDAAILPKGGAATPFIAVEMGRVYENTSIQAHAWRRLKQEDSIGYLGLASSYGCALYTDNTHFTGPALQTLGYERVFSAWQGVRDGFGAARSLDLWRVEVPGSTSVGSPFEVAAGIPNIYVIGLATAADMHVRFDPSLYEEGHVIRVRNRNAGASTLTVYATARTGTGEIEYLDRPGFWTTSVVLYPGEMASWRRTTHDGNLSWELVSYSPSRGQHIQLKGNASGSAISTASGNILNIWSVDEQQGLTHSAGEITIRYGGMYCFTGAVWVSASSAGQIALQVKPSGGSYASAMVFGNAADATARSIPISTTLRLSAGDTVRLAASGATVDMPNGNATYNKLTVVRLPN